MGLLRGIRARLRAITHPASADRELSEEIRFHIELETEKNMRAGMPPGEARRVAIVHFGGVQRVREEHHDVRRLQWIEDLASDMRFAFRALRRTPGLALAAVITLALGIGANVAIFSAVNAVVLRPLPVPSPDRLVMIAEENPEKGWHLNVAAPANYLDWREQVGAFQDAAAYASWISHPVLTGFGESRLLDATAVTGNFFTMLGIRPLIGRGLRDEDTWRRPTPAVISYRAWRDVFGADSSIVGRTVKLDGRDVPIVGVMPEGVAFPWEKVDVWTSIGWQPAQRAQASFRRAHWIRVIAKLEPGVTYAQADAQLQTVVERLKQQYPATNRVMGASLTPLHRFLVGDTRLPLLVLLGSVALLLLLACANVGSLLLVQAAAREREGAVRLALGAGTLRLARQALAESLVLSFVGGAFGLLLGWIGTRVLEAMQPPNMLRVSHFSVDGTVLAFVTAVSCMSGMLFAIAPALRARRRDPAEALSGGSRGGTQSRRTRRWGDALVVSEVAIALMLTVGAGLLARSLWKLRHVEPGFDPNGVLAVEVGLNHSYDSAGTANAFWDQFLDRVKAIPGVTSAAHASSLPLLGVSYTSDFIAAGRPAEGYGSEVGHRRVSRDYFKTMKVPILRGRAFTAEDRIGSPLVVVINDRLAKTYFANQDPVGQRVTFDKVPTEQSIWYTIVGVVGDEHQSGLDVRPQIEILNPREQDPGGADYAVLRTSGDPSLLAPAVRKILCDMDPSLAIASSHTMVEYRDASLARARFLTTLLASFALVGLVLSIVGVYGLLAQLARNRTREMGIRLALGSPRSRVRWLVVRRGLVITSVGLAIGGAVALIATRAMTKLLFETPANDPWTIAGVALLLAATSALASWLPALRASRADPASALRAD